MKNIEPSRIVFFFVISLEMGLDRRDENTMNRDGRVTKDWIASLDSSGNCKEIVFRAGER